MSLTNYADRVFLAVGRYRRLRDTEPGQLGFDAVRREFRALIQDVGSPAGPDMRKVMTYFVDDIFMQENWPFRDQWRARPLEEELFGTRAGAANFYQTLDHYFQPLSGRAAGPVTEATREVLRIFYICLGLGFQGELRGTPGAADTRLQALAVPAGAKGGIDEPILQEAYEFDGSDYGPPPARYMVWVTKGLIVAAVAAVVAYVVTFYAARSDLIAVLAEVIGGGAR
jgi:type VI protein secretion system component VasF